MRNVTFLMLLVVAGIAGVSHVPVAAAQGGAWTKLFKGKDLSNWNVTGDINDKRADQTGRADRSRCRLRAASSVIATSRSAN